ncbi:helix-turn-helix domain-containing protein [Mucilaginibacter agri]|uniref:Helix-turn-helix domain-containing protein n=1 Tax=Mucilaginibacter agri TaxID=2695265 RepID=A0A965ZB26_9SPHI|nr:helix-turn-helix transcriptional regulator [Mucilaginibacter agri]NCD67758.1 helix-turn-helix domain-containing protein [Mucilaginibacter agri]
MFNTQALADYIKEHRGLKGFGQLYLATKLNISQNCYSKMEQGYSKISFERLFEIAKLLDFDPIEALLVGRDTPHVIKIIITQN